MSPTVDVQGHYMPGSHWRALSEEVERSPAFASLARGVVAPARGPGSPVASIDDDRVALMDAAGIDVMVLSIPPPGAVFGAEERRPELAAAFNDDLVEAAARYLGRFLVLGTLPLPLVDESIAEVERLAAMPLARGVLVNVDSTDWTLDEGRFEPLYERLAALELPLFIHPTVEKLPNAYLKYGLVSSAGAMVGTTLTGLRLIMSGLLDRVPKLDLVIPHLGGTIPYITQRVADANGTGDAEHEIAYYLRNRIWTDTCNYWHPALHCAVDTFGTERIMLGSDYPFRGALDTCVRDIRTADIPEETKQAILGGNAQRFFSTNRS